MSVRVLIADDHATVRMGLRARLRAAKYDVVGEANSPEEVLHILATTSVDVVLTELAMQNRGLADGLEYLDNLSRHYPLVRVIVFTAVRRPALLNAVLRKGIAGLIDKACSRGQIMHALRRVRGGRFYLSDSLLELAGSIRGGDRPIRTALSPREEQILKLIAEGKQGLQIAEILGTSTSTVSTQKASMMRKLGLRNKFDLRDYLAWNNDLGVSP